MLKKLIFKLPYEWWVICLLCIPLLKVTHNILTSTLYLMSSGFAWLTWALYKAVDE